MTSTHPSRSSAIDLMTTSQAAERLGVRAGSVARWHRLGLLPSVGKLPGRTGALLFDASVVERFRAARAAGDGSPTQPVPGAGSHLRIAPQPDSWVCPECRVRVIGDYAALKAHRTAAHR